MRLHKYSKLIICCMVVAVSAFLGGCSMGGVSGKETGKGIEALDQGNYQDAVACFRNAVQSGEEAMLAYRGLGLAFMGLGQYEEAEIAFQAALDHSDGRQPENTEDIRLYLATVQYRQEKYEDVIITCDALLTENEDGNADAYFLRGAGYLLEKQETDAAKDFDAAVALAPDDYDMYLNIYECYKKQNLSGLGGQYLQSALNIQGDTMDHSYNRGRVYYYLENYDLAQSELIGPVEKDYEPAMFLIGQVYLALGDLEHARAIYEKIQEKFDADARTYNGLALCALESRDYDQALGYISEGLGLGEQDGKQELCFNEIVAYERKRDFSTAKAKAQEYIQRYPSDEAGQKEWTFLSTR